VIFSYRRLRTKAPVVSLGGVSFRHKPIIRVILTSASVSQSVEALLDTGSDDTVFPKRLADKLGLNLVGAPEARQYRTPSFR
jgi:predicted aspartyl protease